MLESIMGFVVWELETNGLIDMNLSWRPDLAVWRALEPSQDPAGRPANPVAGSPDDCYIVLSVGKTSTSNIQMWLLHSLKGFSSDLFGWSGSIY